MKFSESISVCLSKYATFHGRATRSEYWWFYLFSVLMGWGSIIVDQVLVASVGYGFTNIMLTLGLFLPSVSVMVRRLHDTGRSGWWWLINLTIVGIPFFIYWLAIQGNLGENKYDTDSNSDNHAQDSQSLSTAQKSLSSEQLDLVAKLHEMKEKGIISEEEFQQKKSSLLQS